MLKKPSPITTIEADLSNPGHANALISLLDTYAHDPAGGGRGLNEFAKKHLASTLQARSDNHVIFAFVEDIPVGLTVCFDGFSTFACKPLLNIHDVVVLPAYRGKGIAREMFRHVEKIAKNKGCCKLTLEVLEGNKIAMTAYSNFGFKGYELDPKMGKALFWQKEL